MLITIVACFACRRLNRKNEVKKEEKIEVDENPVYQQYQLVGDGENYERQYSTHEAVDRNDYYE